MASSNRKSYKNNRSTGYQPKKSTPRKIPQISYECGGQCIDYGSPICSSCLRYHILKRQEKRERNRLLKQHCSVQIIIDEQSVFDGEIYYWMHWEKLKSIYKQALDKINSLHRTDLLMYDSDNDPLNLNDKIRNVHPDDGSPDAQQLKFIIKK